MPSVFTARRPLVVLVWLVAALAFSASAQAKRVIAPPGNSGVSQYVEVVPSAEGGVTAGAQSHNHAHVLTSNTERVLKSLGPEGKAVAAFAQATGTSTTGSGKHDHGGAYHGAGKNSGGGSAPSIVKTASVSSGSLGWGLPLALGLAALFAIAVLVLRRRSSASRDSDSD